MWCACDLRELHLGHDELLLEGSQILLEGSDLLEAAECAFVLGLVWRRQLHLRGVNEREV